MHNLEKWFDQFEPAMIETADYIFKHPELAYEEQISSHCLSEFLQKQGFSISYNTADIPTAFTATWGSGKPVIAFLAEYDALPGLGQQPVCHPSPIEGAGHGCGHNLLGTAVAAAASALKCHLEAHPQSGTLRVYGCPAEEIMSGKIVMNQKGIFDDVDAAVTWHPFDQNRISNDVWLSQDIKTYRFYGKTAHAAKNPELGRSALDAAELMHVGVNYLREHVSDDVRIHYAYQSASPAANIVPDFAQTNFFIRSAKRARTDDAAARVDDCARGAALMTGTRVEIELNAGCYEMKVNRPMMELYYQAMQEVPLPEYTSEELTFAETISEAAGFDNNGQYFEGLKPLEDQPCILSIGTDVSDVSHTVPTITISAAAMCKGTPLHHWSTTAQAGMSIGHKGMIYAAKCMANGTRLLLETPGALDAIWKEHKQTD